MEILFLIYSIYIVCPYTHTYLFVYSFELVFYSMLKNISPGSARGVDEGFARTIRRLLRTWKYIMRTNNAELSFPPQ